MSDTPRTDYEATLSATGLWVTTTFAQQLERENARLRKALETIQANAEKSREHEYDCAVHASALLRITRAALSSKTPQPIAKDDAGV